MEDPPVVLAAMAKSSIFWSYSKTDDDARAVMETLPFAKKTLMDNEYIPSYRLIAAAGIDGR